MFIHTTDILKGADITFGQLEAPHSDKGSRGSSGARGAVPKDVRMLRPMAEAGFNLISLASNHTMDWGAAAMQDCIDRLERDGSVLLAWEPISLTTAETSKIRIE